jgi:hypothetical protein
MVKVAVCVPAVPQAVALQALQADQLPTQLTGQGSALQDCCLVSPFTAGQVPPYAAGVVTVKVAVCVPAVPQAVALQELQADQLPTPLTGQGSALQDCCLVSPFTAGQVPPYAAVVVMVKVAVCVPAVPQAVALQELQADQLPTHLTGVVGVSKASDPALILQQRINKRCKGSMRSLAG